MQVTVDIAPGFAAYLASNRSPVPGNPGVRQLTEYGVSALLHDAFIELALTFRAGSSYFCCEWGCHLDLYEGNRWERLRRELSAHGIEMAEPTCIDPCGEGVESLRNTWRAVTTPNLSLP
jgi:hypothetical protein